MPWRKRNKANGFARLSTGQKHDHFVRGGVNGFKRSGVTGKTAADFFVCQIMGICS
jgi:hypothetical protein